LLQPLGISTRFINSLFSVFSGYVANIVLPRFGEVWRCVLVARYEKVSFEKLFGSVVAERIADVIVVSGVMALTVALQFALLGDKIDELVGDKFTTDSIAGMAVKLGFVVIIGLVVAFYGWRLMKRSGHPLFVKI
jgi:hypothetical protein